MDFLGKFGKHMADVGENLGINSEVTKLNNDIQKEQGKINDLFFYIGKSYYEAHYDDENAEEHDRISQINECVAKIKKNKAKINELRNVIICDNCGSEIPSDSSFCTSCGAKVEKEVIEENAEEITCPSCHKEVTEDEVFCRHCGFKLKEN